MTLYIVLNSILIVLNWLLLVTVLWFSRRVHDKPSKIGFGVMNAVYTADIAALIGGILLCL